MKDLEDTQAGRAAWPMAEITQGQSRLRRLRGRRGLRFPEQEGLFQELELASDGPWGRVASCSFTAEGVRFLQTQVEAGTEAASWDPVLLSPMLRHVLWPLCS